MVQEGVSLLLLRVWNHEISVDDAGRLLDGRGIGKGQSLRVALTENGRPKANVALPLGMAKIALKLLPKEILSGVELQGPVVDELLEAARKGEIFGKILEVTNNGVIVEVYVE